MMPSSNINFYNAVDLDTIIENAITKAAEHEPDFIVANEKKVTAALRKYTENILKHGTPRDSEEMQFLMEKHAGELLDTFCDANHSCIKNGMRLGANLLLQLTTLS